MGEQILCETCHKKHIPAGWRRCRKCRSKDTSPETGFQIAVGFNDEDWTEIKNLTPVGYGLAHGLCWEKIENSEGICDYVKIKDQRMADYFKENLGILFDVETPVPPRNYCCKDCSWDYTQGYMQIYFEIWIREVGEPDGKGFYDV
jgi:hypothetical protein